MAVTLQCGITVNSQDQQNNTSNITAWVNAISTYGSWNHLDSYGSITFGGNASGTYQFDAWFDADTTTRIYTRTFDVAHNADGSCYVSFSVAFNTNVSAGTVYGSASLTLPVIPRGSVCSISGNLELGAAITINTNRASSQFVHTIRWDWAGHNGIISQNVTDSVVWTPSLEIMAPYLTDAPEATCTITCITRNSQTGVQIGATTTTFLLRIPATTRPSITSINVVDSKGYETKYGNFVQNNSNIVVNTSAYGIYGSKIARYEVSMDGLRSDGSTPTATLGAPPYYGLRTVTVKVTDTRGRSFTATQRIGILQYSLPTLSGTDAYRWDADAGEESDESTTIRVDVKVNVTDPGDKTINYAQVKIFGKVSTDDEYTQIAIQNCPPPTYSFSAYIEDISETIRYDILVQATDQFGITAIWQTRIYTAQPVLDIRADGKAAAFFGVSNFDGLKVAGDITIGYTKGLYIESDAGEQQPLLEIDPNGINDRSIYHKHFALTNNHFLQAELSSGLFTNLLCVDATDVTRMFWTQGGLRGRVRSLLWSGSLASGGSALLPLLPYFNMILVFPASQTRVPIVFNRTTPNDKNTGSATFLGAGGFASSDTIRVYAGELSVSTGTTLKISQFGYFLNNNTTFVADSISRVEGIL